MRIKAILSLLVAFLLWSNVCQALPTNANFVFLYPGEAGTTKEAQPFLNAFSEYVDDRIAPYSIVCKYFNDLDKGVAALKKSNIQFGIISYSTWKQNRVMLPDGDVWLATLPLPGGSQYETYSMVGLSKSPAPGTEVFTSEPLGYKFVQGELFPAIPQGIKLTKTPQILFKLKEISDGKIKGTAILTPMEAATLSKLSATWAKKLKVISVSKSVPTARVVVFDPVWKGRKLLKKVFLNAHKDTDAADILAELRLKGFAEIKVPSPKTP
jgi:hypothetical protein